MTTLACNLFRVSIQPSAQQPSAQQPSAQRSAVMSFHRAFLLSLVALIGCTTETDVPSEIVKKAEGLGDPLLTAIEENQLEAVSAALDEGADPNIPEKGDLPPLHLAASKGMVEVGELLIKRNADINLRPLRTFESESGEKIERPGETALHIAITSGKLDFVAMLIRRKADLNAKNGRGMTPLDLANSQRRFLEREEINEKEHEVLVAIGEQLDATDAIIALLKEQKANTTEELHAAKLKQALKEEGTGGILGRINEKIDKKRFQQPDPDGDPLDSPLIDPAKKQDEELYDLDFDDPSRPNKKEDPDELPGLFSDS
ncbi:MAG TPA: ankyrin repeat domain-containing protein [Pirellulales bacterium]|nr:ankyrin repeat domain-containing protein [Pirellulales bacterium]